MRPLRIDAAGVPRLPSSGRSIDRIARRMERIEDYAVDREWIAYGLIGLTFLIAAPWTWVTWRQRQRQKLRRRGIKTYGH